MPPFFKLTLVVLCAYILWTFNHPENVYPPGDVHLVRHRYSYPNGQFNEAVQGDPSMGQYNQRLQANIVNQPPPQQALRPEEKVNYVP